MPLQADNNGVDTADELQEQVALTDDVADDAQNTLAYCFDTRSQKDILGKLAEVSLSRQYTDLKSTSKQNLLSGPNTST